MIAKTILRAAAFGLFVALGACAQSETKTPATQSVQADGVYREELAVETANGPVRFMVEIADDDAERQRGLMFRREMARDHGMLFQFEAPEPQSFWMRNTHLPLDIIFIGADGRIINIVENTTPYTDTPVPSTGPANGVLEINGGLSRELGIAPGNRIRHPFYDR